MARGMPLRLFPDEARYVLRGVTVVAGAVLGLGVFWFSPWSPEAIDRPALMLGWGFPNLAYQGWVDLSQSMAPSDTRAEALWRAANLAATDLERPQAAVELLRTLVAEHVDHVRAPEAQDRLASLYAGALRDPLRAAETWESAAKTWPDDFDAGRWWLEAGLSFARANAPDRAAPAFRAAAETDPALAVDAWLALGNALLAEDPEGAHAAFVTASRQGASGEEASLAALGAATALERLDRPDEALVTLEETIAAGDGDEAVRLRAKMLRARTAP